MNSKHPGRKFRPAAGRHVPKRDVVNEAPVVRDVVAIRRRQKRVVVNREGLGPVAKRRLKKGDLRTRGPIEISGAALCMFIDCLSERE